MYGHVPRRVRFQDLCDALVTGTSALDVLPSEVAAVLSSAPTPVVLVDFAGRDSVAAAMAWLADHPVGTLVPVGDIVPTRYGDWSVYERNWLQMRDQLQSRYPSVVFAPWFVLEDVDVWRALNSRYMNELIRAFGFFTPCLGCHLHFYAMRAVLGHTLGATVLLSGEKELHGNKRKVNQTREAVEGYKKFSALHQVNHQFPIYNMQNEAEMANLLGNDWREGERQLQCSQSGNDQDLNGKLMIEPSQVRAYMNKFAIPLATHIIALRRQGCSDPELDRQIAEKVQMLLAESQK